MMLVFHTYSPAAQTRSLPFCVYDENIVPSSRWEMTYFLAPASFPSISSIVLGIIGRRRRVFAILMLCWKVWGQVPVRKSDINMWSTISTIQAARKDTSCSLLAAALETTTSRTTVTRQKLRRAMQLMLFWKLLGLSASLSAMGQPPCHVAHRTRRRTCTQAAPLTICNSSCNQSRILSSIRTTNGALPITQVVFDAPPAYVSKKLGLVVFIPKRVPLA